MKRLMVVALLLAGALHGARAQQIDSMQAMMGAMEAMNGDHMAHMKHMKWSASRSMSVRDSLRAIATADTLRRAIAKYADTTVAVRDGYVMFMPQNTQQAMYHFTRNASALKAVFTFDPASPTSLLYTKDKSGHLKLVGAMYTAPANYSAAKLDARVPLSVAQWHQHVNLCVPRDPARLDHLRSGAPDTLFGLAGTIADKAACDKANGRFVDRIYGWMVHVYVIDHTSLHDIFETEASHK